MSENDIEEAVMSDLTALSQKVSVDDRPVIEGDTVTAYARLLHKGRTLHVWNVDIKNTAGELISNVRVTNYIIKQPKKK